MQRVFAVKFSGDATYVFSGSDDMNVRVWKVRLEYYIMQQQELELPRSTIAAALTLHQPWPGI